MSSGGAPILVVEDDADIRDIVTMVLDLQGYTAVGARDGEDALRRLHDHLDPALILLDLRMPGLDGAEFMRELRADASLSHTPVVVISGEVRAREEADSLGARGFLPKPVDVDDLLATVERYAPH